VKQRMPDRERLKGHFTAKRDKMKMVAMAMLQQ
jgi:glutathione S-transferase